MAEPAVNWPVFVPSTPWDTCFESLPGVSQSTFTLWNIIFPESLIPELLSENIFEKRKFILYDSWVLKSKWPGLPHWVAGFGAL